MKKLSCGIIGTGGIANNKHIPGYLKLKDDVEIVALCDIDEEALNKTAEKHNLTNTKRFTDYKELLALEEIDFVSVCLPNYLHAPVTIEALKAGKHVHCEKPMTINEANAQEMLRVSKETNKKLMIGLNNRFTPYAMYVRDYIKQGNLGNIYFAKCGWRRRNGLPHSGWFSDKSQSGGGALIDLGVHFIDLVMHYMNYPGIKSVTAKKYCKFGQSNLKEMYTFPSAKLDPNIKFDVEDLAVGFIDMKNDASISFEISWASNIEKEMVSYELYGEKAGVKFTDDFVNPPKLQIFTSESGQLVDVIPKINPYLYDETEFKHFTNCIRTNQEPTIAPPEQAVEMMKLIDAIYNSSKTGKQIVF